MVATCLTTVSTDSESSIVFKRCDGREDRRGSLLVQSQCLGKAGFEDKRRPKGDRRLIRIKRQIQEGEHKALEGQGEVKLGRSKV